MDDEIELTIEAAGDEPVQAAAHLPVNFIPVGEIQNDDVKVYVRQDVYRAIDAFAATDISRELGSILVGSERVEMGKRHVIISGFIEAKHTDATASTLTFTHETWDQVHAEKSQLYPELKIVGWQHTHPNYGIFLSNYDLFIQQNFFDLEFQVAYVVDPVSGAKGFFQWRNGRVEKLGGFYVYDEVGKKIKPVDEVKKPEGGSRGGGRGNIPVVAVVALALVAVAASAYAFTMKADIGRLESRQAELSGTVDSQRGTIESQRTVIGEQESEIAILQADSGGAGGGTAASDGSTAGLVYFKRYVVKRGDNLTSICRENGISYRENWRAIASVNGLADINVIRAGRTILLPASTMSSK